MSILKKLTFGALAAMGLYALAGKGNGKGKRTQSRRDQPVKDPEAAESAAAPPRDTERAAPRKSQARARRRTKRAAARSASRP